MIVAAGLWASSDAANAQPCTSSGTPVTDIFCGSQVRIDTVLPTGSAERVDTYSTRLVGRLDGDSDFLYDQSFAFPFGDPAITAGVLTAQQILQGQSSDPLSFDGPTLLESSALPVSSSTQIRQVGTPVETVFTLTLFGPGSTLVGDFGTCADFGLGSNNALVATGCSGAPEVLNVGDDTALFSGYRILTYTFEPVTTTTWLTTALYEVVGRRTPNGSVPVPGTLALLGLGLFGMSCGRRIRR